MKKLILISLLFTGCMDKCIESSSDNSVGIVNIGNGFADKSVYHFYYKGHDYIQFGTNSMSYGVHDPDCKNPKCNK